MEEKRTRTAGTDLAHFPEVILGSQWNSAVYVLVSFKDVVVGEVRSPDRVGFLIARNAVLLRALEVGGIETRGVQLVDLRQEFPGEVDGSFFEVVSERPVSKHLEEGVVIPRVRKSTQNSPTRPYPHHQDRCAFHQHGCTSESCTLSSA